MLSQHLWMKLTFPVRIGNTPNAKDKEKRQFVHHLVSSLVCKWTLPAFCGRWYLYDKTRMLPITSLGKPNSARKFTTSNLHTFAFFFFFPCPLATLSSCTSCVSFAPFDSYLSLLCMLFIPFEIPYLLLHPVCLGAEMAHNFTHSSSSNTFSSQPGNMHRKQQTS